MSKSELADAEIKLNALLPELVLQGCKTFFAGGALGFDMLAAFCVLKLKENDPEITLKLFLPSMEQTEGWPEFERKRYEKMLERCDGYSFLSKKYTREHIFERNRLLIDYSNLCVCYCKHGKGGTAYTVGYAKKKNKPIINLAGDSVS